MDFSRFDIRKYPMVGVTRGYGEWAGTYEDCVRDEMDLRLLDRLTCIGWSAVERAVDLACGSGRVGAWLRTRGVAHVDGIDMTPQMLHWARERGVYDDLREGDLRETPFADGHYDLATVSLADEHLPDLSPMYAEAARLLQPEGWFVLAGYHPQFLMTVGMPTHYHAADGQAVAIETYVHLLSDHVRAARERGLALIELEEGLVDEQYVAAKPKWSRYRDTPVSFVAAWRRAR
ncbi:MAG: class I SAM-dependent DNA methyltransferase [Planctomycetota bacterium]|jgi:predicted TPR repeat methyltransferase